MGNKKTEKALDDMDKKMDNNHKVLLEYIEANDEVVKTLKKDITKITNRLETTEATATEMETHLSALSDDLEATCKQCYAQQQQIDELTTKERERYEEKKRSNNIIDGIKEDHTDTLECKVTQLLNDIGVNVKPGHIMTAFRLGNVKQVNKARPRPILVKLGAPSVKYDIYKHVKYLKGNDDWKRVFVSDDLPREVAEKRKILRCLAATARDRGHRATVRGAALVIDDMKYTYNEIQDLPD